MHKYLDKLKKNLPKNIYTRHFPHEFKINDKKLTKKRRKKYGFDQRELYDMQLSFCAWLYERLCAYEDWTNVKLVGKEPLVHVCYNEKNYTQYELMQKLKKRIRLYFDVHIFRKKEDNDKNRKKINEIYSIWQALSHVMWW